MSANIITPAPRYENLFNPVVFDTLQSKNFQILKQIGETERALSRLVRPEKTPVPFEKFYRIPTGI